MTARDDLLASLLVERQDQTWWTRKPAPADGERDNDLACARRRRELLAAWDEHVREVG